ncbi:probable cytochrome P450 304a1 isoform X2 [Ostrinia furnacalis]|uniref:probable cytochrome P450 304a1 isoform X2 n=1 Tax=Ostrinia furnacalis TaxID=93504 RepID=UPI00103BFAD6|nr:probable cytochrome P450 304a1 isoform X2 [Ostrinia furnacalis]
MISAIIAAIAVPFIFAYFYKNAYKRPKNFPPGPPSLPVYGAYWIILATEFNNLSEAFRKIGQKYKSKIIGMFLGPFRTIVINDPGMIKDMLYHEDFDGRVDSIVMRMRSYWKKLGIFFTDGYFWHVQRRFSQRYMRDFGFGRRDQELECVLEGEIKEMIDMAVNGPKYPAEHELVKGDLVYMPHYFAAPFVNGLLHVVSRMTLPRAEYDALWKLARGALLFQRSSDDIGRALAQTPWLKNIIPNLSGYNALKEGNQALLDFYTQLIKEVMATQDDSYDRHFLDMYIKTMKEDNTKGRSTFSVDQLALTCADYTLPAASAVEAVLAILVERLLLQPEIQDHIHEEIDRVVGRGRLPNLDDRKDMPYTEACIRETMRLDTLVPLGVAHRAVVDTKFHGYDIPEDTMVTANYMILHHSKEIWGDPEVFRPERFIKNGKLDAALDKSLPFGAGRRLCAGETYARQCMFQVFSGFMQAFRVSTADGKPLKEPVKRLQGIINTVPDYWVRVTPRS